MFSLIATLLITNPQEAEWDHEESETLDILRVHFLWAQPEIFVVCETSMVSYRCEMMALTTPPPTAENIRSFFLKLMLKIKCKIIQLFMQQHQPP